jgi:hypothetical protein
LERDELERPREPVDLERLRELEELPDLRRVLAAVLRPRDLAPALRVLRAGLARRDVLLAEVFVELRLAAVFFFAAPFVSPDLLRCLFTTRAASSSARPSLAPRLRADCLIFEYCR